MGSQNPKFLTANGEVRLMGGQPLSWIRWLQVLGFQLFYPIFFQLSSLHVSHQSRTDCCILLQLSSGPRSITGMVSGTNAFEKPVLSWQIGYLEKRW